MSETIDQADAIERILNQIETILKSGLTPAVNVIAGEALNYSAGYPRLWIAADRATIVHDRSITETWKLPIALIADCYMKPDMSHRMEAYRLASRAQSIAVKDRRMKLDFVQDVVKAGLDPRRIALNKSEGRFCVAGIIEITFNIREI